MRGGGEEEEKGKGGGRGGVKVEDEDSTSFPHSSSQQIACFGHLLPVAT